MFRPRRPLTFRNGRMYYRLRRWILVTANCPGPTLGVLLAAVGLSGVVTNFVTVAVPGMDPQLSWPRLIISALALLLLICAAAWWTLKALPPDRYAQILVSGAEFDDAIQILSFAAEDACERFLRTAAKASNCMISLEEAAWADIDQAARQRITDLLPKAKEQIDKHANRISGYIKREERCLARLIAMKEAVSDRAGIPVRRLCDHFLQYSPLMHDNRVRKYGKNLEEMYSILNQVLDKESVLRLRAVLRDNERVVADAEDRKDRQMHLREHIGIYRTLRDLAATHSTSNAVKIYCAAIRESVARCDRAGGGPEAKAQRLSRALRFLTRARHLHAGFDVGMALIAIVKRAVEIEKPEPDRALRLRRTRDLLMRLHDQANEGHEAILFEDGSRASASDDQNRLKLNDAMDDLRGLVHDVRRSRMRNRDYILGQFREIYRNGFRDTSGEIIPREPTEPGKTAVVIHGYGKTVRDVVRSGLLQVWLEKARQVEEANRASTQPESEAPAHEAPAHSEEEILAALTGVSDDSKKKARSDAPLIWLLRTEEADPLDLRVMEYEVRMTRDQRGYSRLVSGSLDAFKHAAQDFERILVVLGAECIDGAVRLIHPWGIGESLGDLMDAATHARVLVVADDYKVWDDPLQSVSMLSQNLDTVRIARLPLDKTVVISRGVVRSLRPDVCEQRDSRPELPH